MSGKIFLTVEKLVLGSELELITCLSRRLQYCMERHWPNLQFSHVTVSTNRLEELPVVSVNTFTIKVAGILIVFGCSLLFCFSCENTSRGDLYFAISTVVLSVKCNCFHGGGEIDHYFSSSFTIIFLVMTLAFTAWTGVALACTLTDSLYESLQLSNSCKHLQVSIRSSS